MARSRKVLTNFSAGVLSPSVNGRIDMAQYNNGLSIGRNIVIEATGGASARPGTLYVDTIDPLIQDVRLLPFAFNQDQKYLIVLTDQQLRVYYNDELQIILVTPYLAAELNVIDFASSADSMILTHASHAPQQLTRLGAHNLWSFSPVIFAPAPPEWVPNNYPRVVTFHQSRLWFASTPIQPQSVWGSQIQDFFNFDVGTGLDNEAISEILDSNEINPIQAIYSERKLMLFTIGGEYINESAQVITPATSRWTKQSNYGSRLEVQPTSSDGVVLFLDRSGRNIRQFVFSDSEKAFTSDSVSILAEHLIVAPVRLGQLRGRLSESSNYVYVVNETGDIAVLNLIRSQSIAAWTQWQTNGQFLDIVSVFNDDVYIAVKRNGTIIIEKLFNGMYVDSGTLENRLVDTTTEQTAGDEQNYFSILYNLEGKGKVVIRHNDIEVYRSGFFKINPMELVQAFGVNYKPGPRWSDNPDLKDEIFRNEAGTDFFLRKVITVEFVVESTNFINGLPHLIGQEVVLNLDGNVQNHEIVIAGDEIPGGGVVKTYPEGTGWEYERTTPPLYFIEELFNANGTVVSATITHNDVVYSNVILEENGYKIIDDVNGYHTYIEQGVVREEIPYDPPAPNTEQLNYTDGSEKQFTVPAGVILISTCFAGGGGSNGSIAFAEEPFIVYTGGFRGEIQTLQDITVTPGEIINYTVGAGGDNSIAPPGEFSGKGFSTIFNSVEATGGGAGGSSDNPPGYYGDGAEFISPCGETYNDGAKLLGEGNADGYGGQAGAFGNGGRAGGSGLTVTPTGGGIGAGGGGGIGSVPINGGNGRIEIAYDIPENLGKRYRQQRLMKLEQASVPVTDGVVPTRNYQLGQAGLWFPVEIETMDLNVDAGAGSLVNEPKRVISCTAKFKNTVGFKLNNYQVPSRNFGPNVLDNNLKPRDGIEKIRFLGYSRENKIRITQNDPLPFSLLHLDIEINY